MVWILELKLVLQRLCRQIHHQFACATTPTPKVGLSGVSIGSRPRPGAFPFGLRHPVGLATECLDRRVKGLANCSSLWHRSCASSGEVTRRVLVKTDASTRAAIRAPSDARSEAALFVTCRFSSPDGRSARASDTNVKPAGKTSDARMTSWLRILSGRACESPPQRMNALRARLSVMIRLAEPDPHLLAESEERSTQQTNCYHEKKAGSVFLLQPEERAREQRRAHPAGKCQVCKIVQEFGPRRHARNIRLEVGPRGIVVRDLIQGADAVEDSRHPSQQDRSESGHRTERRPVPSPATSPRELTCVRKVHARATAVRRVVTMPVCDCRARAPRGV